MSSLVIKSVLPWWVTILMMLYSSNVYKGNTDGSRVTKRGASASYWSTASWLYIIHLAASIKMYLDLLDTSCANWHNVKLYQQRMLERLPDEKVSFLDPSLLAQQAPEHMWLLRHQVTPNTLPSILALLHGHVLHSVFRETAPISSFPWCSMGRVAGRSERGNVWASSPAQSQSGDSVICRIPQQLLCQPVDHSQDLCNKLPPLALVDTLLQHSSSFLIMQIPLWLIILGNFGCSNYYVAKIEIQ